MYESVIGLEVHVQLKTKTKAFCGCSTEFGREPNSQVCPVCLGLPGSLPVLNKTVLEYAVRVALALNCQIEEYTKFDRKNYFYPDLPKNYQISQYDLPISKDGFLNIELKGKNKRIGIRRLHIEEDAGKLIHQEEVSLVDFNRTGIPLLEIVSQPQIDSPEESDEYLNTLKNIIEYLDVSDCDMEKGSLRCDANISIREKGASNLGIKVELKNMNSFKAVREALAFEIERQTKLLNSGKSVISETRLWETKALETIPMRRKEETQDYRYFPEPDLAPFIIKKEVIEESKKNLPELPQQKISRFMKDYSLSEYDSKRIVASKKYAEITERRIKQYPGENKKAIVNWSTGPLLWEANSRNCPSSELIIPGGDEELIKLVKAVEDGRLSNLTAKAVLNESITTGKFSSVIINERNLLQISDSATLEAEINEVIKENSKSVQDFQAGKVNALMFLVGQVMKKTANKANPKVVQEMLKRRLSNE